MEPIRLECEGAPENWIDFSRAVTRPQIAAYFEAINKADDAALLAVYRRVVTDANLVDADGVAVRWADLVALDLDRFPVMVVDFFARAFSVAVRELRALGNPKRPG